MITDYASLVDAITDQLDDAGLADSAPLFIQLAEAMFNRRLHTLDCEGTATATAAAQVALPADFKGLRTVWLDDYGPLAQLGPDDFQQLYREDTSTGVPVHYSLFSGTLNLGPLPDAAYTINLTYLRTLTALSDSSTSNWLLEQHPDLYLYASLLHAEFRGWNDDRLPMLNSAVEGLLAEINAHDARKRLGNRVADVAGAYF